MSGAPRVVLVDDHGLFRSGVRSELGRQVEVIGEAEADMTFAAGVRQIQQDVEARYGVPVRR